MKHWTHFIFSSGHFFTRGIEQIQRHRQMASLRQLLWKIETEYEAEEKALEKEVLKGNFISPERISIAKTKENEQFATNSNFL